LALRQSKSDLISNAPKAVQNLFKTFYRSGLMTDEPTRMTQDTPPNDKSSTTNEVTLEWHLAQAIRNIESAVTDIQTSVKGAWSGQSGATLDSAELGATIKTALTDALINAQAQMNLDKAVSPETKQLPPTIKADDIAEAVKRSLTEYTAHTMPVISHVEIEKAVRRALLTITKNRKWNHAVWNTPEPPSEAMLDKAGLQGYELVSVIYDSGKQEWVTILKKLVMEK
jgi:hypothetical protein